MKKLPKLDLHGAHIMNDRQLKRILGGDGAPDQGYVTTCTEKTIDKPCLVDGWKGTCQHTIGSNVGCV